MRVDGWCRHGHEISAVRARWCGVHPPARFAAMRSRSAVAALGRQLSRDYLLKPKSDLTPTASARVRRLD
jgi:hypothetical protein